jgi:hypothetical protein
MERTRHPGGCASAPSSCKFDVTILGAHGIYCDESGARSCPQGHVVPSVGLRHFSCPLPAGAKVLARIVGITQHDGNIGSCGMTLELNGEDQNRSCNKEPLNWGMGR